MKITSEVPCTKPKPVLAVGNLLAHATEHKYLYLLTSKKSGDNNIFAYISFNLESGAVICWASGQFDEKQYSLYKGKLTLENNPE